MGTLDGCHAPTLQHLAQRGPEVHLGYTVEEDIAQAAGNVDPAQAQAARARKEHLMSLGLTRAKPLDYQAEWDKAVQQRSLSATAASSSRSVHIRGLDEVQSLARILEEDAAVHDAARACDAIENQLAMEKRVNARLRPPCAKPHEHDGAPACPPQEHDDAPSCPPQEHDDALPCTPHKHDHAPPCGEKIKKGKSARGNGDVGGNREGRSSSGVPRTTSSGGDVVEQPSSAASATATARCRFSQRPPLDTRCARSRVQAKTGTSLSEPVAHGRGSRMSRHSGNKHPFLSWREPVKARDGEDNRRTKIIRHSGGLSWDIPATKVEEACVTTCAAAQTHKGGISWDIPVKNILVVDDPTVGNVCHDGRQEKGSVGTEAKVAPPVVGAIQTQEQERVSRAEHSNVAKACSTSRASPPLVAHANQVRRRTRAKLAPPIMHPDVPVMGYQALMDVWGFPKVAPKAVPHELWGVVKMSEGDTCEAKEARPAKEEVAMASGTVQNEGVHTMHGIDASSRTEDATRLATQREGEEEVRRTHKVERAQRLLDTEWHVACAGDIDYMLLGQQDASSAEYDNEHVASSPPTHIAEKEMYNNGPAACPLVLCDPLRAAVCHTSNSRRAHATYSRVPVEVATFVHVCGDGIKEPTPSTVRRGFETDITELARADYAGGHTQGVHKIEEGALPHFGSTYNEDNDGAGCAGKIMTHAMYSRVPAEMATFVDVCGASVENSTLSTARTRFETEDTEVGQDDDTGGRTLGVQKIPEGSLSHFGSRYNEDNDEAGCADKIRARDTPPHFGSGDEDGMTLVDRAAIILGWILPKNKKPLGGAVKEVKLEGEIAVPEDEDEEEGKSEGEEDSNDSGKMDEEKDVGAAVTACHVVRLATDDPYPFNNTNSGTHTSLSDRAEAVIKSLIPSSERQVITRTPECHSMDQQHHGVTRSATGDRVTHISSPSHLVVTRQSGTHWIDASCPQKVEVPLSITAPPLQTGQCGSPTALVSLLPPPTNPDVFLENQRSHDMRDDHAFSAAPAQNRQCEPTAALCPSTNPGWSLGNHHDSHAIPPSGRAHLTSSDIPSSPYHAIPTQPTPTKCTTRDRLLAQSTLLLRQQMRNEQEQQLMRRSFALIGDEALNATDAAEGDVVAEIEQELGWNVEIAWKYQRTKSVALDDWDAQMVTPLIDRRSVEKTQNALSHLIDKARIEKPILGTICEEDDMGTIHGAGRVGIYADAGPQIGSYQQLLRNIRMLKEEQVCKGD
eukprot:GEMP01004862.1.p1 GENE.GEMP01004862.1~~GEMP01004862.1.p1  ORF type:complete len:1246 (+),score=315.07 GEMP01004862.1:85-3822(+)